MEGNMWVRTCQECGHKQAMKAPKDQKTDNWRDAKCRKCGSMALDYGKEVQTKE
jgi:ribosomal protein L40E